MKKGTRLYINITNHCNTNCPFCCMYSGTDKHTFMEFAVFQRILDGCPGSFELQMEGGEPILHSQFYLFLEYAIATGRCSKILILSNGLVLEKHIGRIAQIAAYYKILVEFKISVNYWLLQQRENFLEMLDRLVFACSDLEYLHIVLNVRKRKTGDEGMEELLTRYGLQQYSNIYYFQSYGRLRDSAYDKPVIVQNIENWALFASDGTCFGQDVIARSEYEKGLS